MFDHLFNSDDASTLKSINQTFIALIPKKSNAEKIQDYRSISFLNNSYKFFFKCLATRFSPILNSILDASQCTFHLGCSISDCFLVAQETLNFMHSSKTPSLLLKLDFEKAFDNVNWDFLIYTLKGLGCGDKWIQWINMCISSAKFSVLVKGYPKGFFSSSNGPKQGDPLSPLYSLLPLTF